MYLGDGRAVNPELGGAGVCLLGVEHLLDRDRAQRLVLVGLPGTSAKGC